MSLEGAGSLERRLAALTPPQRAALAERNPLSFAQERMWFLDQLFGGSAFYHGGAALCLHGELEVAALAAALSELARRHHVLRSVFPALDGVPAQLVLPAAAVALPVVDLAALAPLDRERAAAALAAHEVARPCRLDQGPVWRRLLLRLATREHRLIATLHHIAADRWSLAILARELGELYAARLAGRPAELPSLPVQYGDFARWQRRLPAEAFAGDLAYWRSQLAALPPPLELPVDHPRPARPGLRGRRHHHHLAAGLEGRLQSVARREGATPFMLVLAALAALLARWTGSQDVLLGSPLGAREREEFEPLIGLFLNTLPLRLRPGRGLSFRQLLAEAGQVALEAQDHAALPFEKIVEAVQPERQLDRNPLFQVLFAYQNVPRERLALGSLEVELAEVERQSALFDLSLSFEEEAEGLSLGVDYSRDLFDATTVARLARHLERLLTAALENPEERLEALPWLAAAEEHQLLREWSDTAVAGDPPSPFELFSLQVAARPEASAVACDGEVLSYGELHRRVRRLAAALEGQGVGPGSRLGLYLERSPEQLQALLAALCLRAAYVPLDPAFPAERLRFMAEDAGLAAILVAERAAAPPEFAVRLLALGELEAPAEGPGAAPGDDWPAYLIYTSGSTGRPKGVVVPASAVSNFLLSMAERPGLSACERLVAITTLSFDIAVLELLLPLVVGAQVVLARRATASDPLRLAGLLAEQAANALQATPATWRALLESGWQPPAGLALLCGGESLPLELAERLCQGESWLWNLYGPTETTVWSTLERWQRGEPSVAAGRPIANTGAFVLDRGGRPLPVGAPGELALGGRGVSWGYSGRPTATAERFRPDPFADRPGQRLYHTGDLVRRGPDGRLEWLGRLDHQVKLRGFRIELGEVEAALASHPGVAQAVALVIGPEPAALVGVVRPRPEQSPAGAALLAHLGQRLPGYMVPSQIVLVDPLPLTPNGKVDRRALGEQVATLRRGAAPEEGPSGSQLAQLLAAIWAEVLGREEVGEHEDFFALGGHSLLAVRLVARLRATVAPGAELRTLFDHPTPASFALALPASSGEVQPLAPIPRLERGGLLPLSSAQQRLWFQDQLEGELSALALPAPLRLSGPLDPRRMSTALGALVARHELLRTRFPVEAGRVWAEITPAGPLALPEVDLSGLPAARRPAEGSRLLAVDLRRRFPLASSPPLRCALLRLSAAEHWLQLTLHHIAGDLGSLAVLLRELSVLYRQGQEALAPLELQHVDFAAWQRGVLAGPGREAELAWWRSTLEDLPPSFELPADRPRLPGQEPRGARASFALAPGLVQALRRQGRALALTPFMQLATGLALLLGRLGRSRDLALATPVAGRDRPELAEMIGPLLNTVAIRLSLAANPTVAEALAIVRAQVLGALAHQELPFDEVVTSLGLARGGGSPPWLAALLAVQNLALPALDFGALEAEPLEVEKQAVQFELVAFFAERQGGLAGGFNYRSDLFDRTTIERWRGWLERLLEGVATRPEARAWDLPWWSPAEHQQLLCEWSESRRLPEAGPEEGPWCLFAAACRRAPERVGVVFEGEHWSYGALAARAAGGAAELEAFGVGPEQLVAICLERSVALVVAVLSVLGAGAAYVPLDPAWPRERLASLLTELGHPWVLSGPLERELLPANARALEPARVPAEPVPAPLPDARQLAYLIYTSGSTGRPKGVMISRGSAAHLARSQVVAFGLGEGERVLQFSAITFDASVSELLTAWAVAGTLVLGRREQLADSGELAGLASRERIDLVTLPPSLLARLAAGSLPAQTTLVVAGEATSAELVDRWAPGRRMLNAYGPTECTVGATVGLCEVGAGAPPALGRPTRGYRLHVVDPGGQLTPPGAPGELWIGGEGVARGYWRRPGETAARFVPDPWSGEPGARLYRTGDLGRQLADGRLRYLGRIDAQLKVHGVRIEPAEIEAAFLAHGAVREAAVQLAWRGAERVLVAYLGVGASGVSESALRAHLAERLPRTLMPAALVLLERLPLSSHGKVDRRALEELPVEVAASSSAGPPRDALERRLAELWQDILGRGAGTVGVGDDFFALGGSSIDAAILVNRLQEELGEHVYVVALFDAPTLGDLGAWLKRHYPAAVERRFGVSGGQSAPEGAQRDGRPLGAADLAALAGRVEPPAAARRARQRRPAIFVLSPPRSGSTLLRVLLGGHSQLFAPPELDLFSFATLGERRRAFSGRFAFWREGLIRAVMELAGSDAPAAERLVEGFEERDAEVSEVLGWLLDACAPRLLVDKTPAYALHPAILERLEDEVPGAHYIHLLRHPQAVIASFVEAHLDQLFFRPEHPYSGPELAELVWQLSQRNILEFQRRVAPERWHPVRFEELVAAPAEVMARLCAGLGLKLEPAMLEPYGDGRGRMTDGIHPLSKMLGDVKFHQHSAIDPAAAHRWQQQQGLRPLAPGTVALAERLGYPAPEAPLSFAQQRFWLAHRLDASGYAYNIPAAVELEGELDARALADALGDLVARHQVLRSFFPVVEGRPVARFRLPAGEPLPRLDLEGLGEGAAAEAARLGAREAKRPFALGTGPVVRMRLLRLGPARHRLLFTAHHIASDAWSSAIVLAELDTLYSARLAGRRAELPELAIQYADFARHQREEPPAGRQAALAYWQRELAPPWPRLALPVDRPEAAALATAGARLTVAVPSPVATRLVALAREESATPFAALLAAFGLVLGHLGGQTDLVVGTNFAERGRPELEGLIGCFVNQLALRLSLAGEPSLRELLRRARRTLVEAQRHGEVPLEQVLEQLGLGPRAGQGQGEEIFEAKFELLNVPRERPRLGPLEVHPLVEDRGVVRYLLHLLLEASEDGGFRGLFQYDGGRLEAATAREWSCLFVDACRLLAERPELAFAAAKAELASAAELRQQESGRLQRQANARRLGQSRRPAAVANLSTPQEPFDDERPNA